MINNNMQGVLKKGPHTRNLIDASSFFIFALNFVGVFYSKKYINAENFE